MTTKSKYKTCQELRRRNLHNYIEEHWEGKVNDFATSIGRTRQQVYKLLADPAVNKIFKPMGSILARDLEIELNLSPGFLDQDHDAIQASDILREIEELSLEQRKAVTSLIRSMS